MVITIREMCVKGFTQVKVIARVHLGHMVQCGVDILEDLLIPNAASHLLDAIYFFWQSSHCGSQAVDVSSVHWNESGWLGQLIFPDGRRVTAFSTKPVIEADSGRARPLWVKRDSTIFPRPPSITGVALWHYEHTVCRRAWHMMDICSDVFVMAHTAVISKLAGWRDTVWSRVCSLIGGFAN